MDVRRCGNCAHARRPTDRFLKMALHDFPGLLICVCCAESQGEMRGVAPCGWCRNYRRRRKPIRSRPVDKPGMRRSRAAAPKKARKTECEIPLSRGLVTVVDPKDYKELSKYKWYAIGKSPHIYAVRTENGKMIYMHRQIMKPPRGRIVDHKDNDSLNNHRINLRVCTRRQNIANRCSRHGSSRFVGVSRHGDKWLAQIVSRGKHYYLGVFDDEVEAAKARDRKAWELHGEFAYLNFPEDYGL